MPIGCLYAASQSYHQLESACPFTSIRIQHSDVKKTKTTQFIGHTVKLAQTQRQRNQLKQCSVSTECARDPLTAPSSANGPRSNTSNITVLPVHQLSVPVSAPAVGQLDRLRCARPGGCVKHTAFHRLFPAPSSRPGVAGKGLVTYIPDIGSHVRFAARQVTGRAQMTGVRACRPISAHTHTVRSVSPNIP